jgi:hypothetical protein
MSGCRGSEFGVWSLEFAYHFAVFEPAPEIFSLMLQPTLAATFKDRGTPNPELRTPDPENHGDKPFLPVLGLRPISL